MKHYRTVSIIVFLLLCAQNLLTAFQESAPRPRVSIITSLYKGEAFIKGFLEDMVGQTIFPECELLIFNADSPENEEPVILEYCARYPNIHYTRLAQDPGLYGVWNCGVQVARAAFVTNANVDDRHNPEWLERQVTVLEQNADIALVYGDFYITSTPNMTFEEAEEQKVYCYAVPEFSPEKLRRCFMGPHPMWRRSVHEDCGYFDATFLSAGDWEFWCRMVSKGYQFKKIVGISGVFFDNPTGLSCHRDPVYQARHAAENRRIEELYQHLWSS